MFDANEARSRIERKIALASVKHMSDAKWRKFFSAMHALPTKLCGVAIKFVNDGRLFKDSIPGPDFVDQDNTGECGGISYEPFSHIEFVQIPYAFRRSLDGPRYPETEFKNDIDGFVAALEELGSFPIQSYENGIRVLGYEWFASAATKEPSK